MSRDYDLVVFGGTGAQFAHAVFETAGMGILTPPGRTFVVDADRSFFDGGLKSLHEAYVKEPAKTLAAAASDGNPSGPLPEMHYVAPYHSPTQGSSVTLLDLLGVGAMSALGQACVSDDEANHNIAQGLYGMAKLGGLLVSAERLQDATRAADRFPGAVIHQLRAGAVAGPIVLAGSVAGGTGAGFMVPFLRALRAIPAFDNRPIYTFMFLPWFSLQPQQGQRIGPDNARMRRNASQGLEYAADVHAELANPTTSTCTFVVGMPPHVQLPLRGAAGMRSEPGPMLYFAASLLSGDFAAIRNVDIANVLPSGLYALRCNQQAPGVKVLGARAVFAVEVVDGAARGSVESVPLEAIQALLRAQEKGFRTLAAAHRFKDAFSKYTLDNPTFLPAVIYDCLKQGRDSTDKRWTAGAEIAKAFETAANAVDAQLKRISALSATSAEFLDFNQVDHLIVEEWEDAFLADVTKLNRVLARTPRLAERVKSQIAQGQIGVAASLLIRALGQGLASGERTLRELKRAATPSAAAALALPVEGLAAAAGQGPFARIDATSRRQLAQALVSGDVPDSQCIPSPLAKARVVDFLVRRSTTLSKLATEPALAASDAGRVVLTFAGLTSGEWSIVERLALGGDAKSASMAHHHMFDRATVEGEAIGRRESVRAPWTYLVRDRVPGSGALAFSSPATGFVPSVGVDEGATPLRARYSDLESLLRSSGKLERIRALYAVFLRDLAPTMPAAEADCPSWYLILKHWTSGVDVVAAQSEFAASAIYGVGPVPFTVPDHPMPWAFLPRLMAVAEREHILSILAVVAASQAPVVSASIGSEGVEIHATRPPTNGRVLVVRPFGTTGQSLTTDQEFRAGALEVLWTSPAGSQTPVGFFGSWQASKPMLRARLAAAQRTAAPQFTMRGLLAEIAALRPEVATALGLTQERLADIDKLQPGPLAPPILNMTAGISWP